MTTITQLPTPPQRGQDQDTFSSNGDKFLAALPTFVTQTNTVATEINTKASEAAASAATASTKATEAAGSANTASTKAQEAAASAGTASTKASEALSSANAAAASATNAAQIAAGTSGNSTTSLLIGAGSKSLTVESGKIFPVGQDVKLSSKADASRYMQGTVTSYSGTTLVVNITSYSGTGTANDWSILVGIAGAQGPAGSLAGANMTGPINLNKGADVASANTVDIWSGTGNYEVITGTATITGFTNAPQAGATRRLLAGAAFSITASANLIIKGIQTGQSYTCTAGDEIDVVAETTSKFRVTVHKGDGTAMSGLYGSFQNTLRITSTGTFTAKRTGWHRITVIGSGGRGGLAYSSGSSPALATGGGAGGFAVGMRFLVAGQSYTAIVGGGNVAATTTMGNVLFGPNGNLSSFGGTGIATITANGGSGGSALLSSGTLSAAAGGTATGGDINVQGGSGGAINSSSVNALAAATGGGAVGIQGIGYSAGSITATVGNIFAATGGAGVGGSSASLVLNTGGDYYTGGGGAGGPSTGVAGGPNYMGVVAGSQASSDEGVQCFFNQTAGGSAGGGSSSGNNGGAAGGQSQGTKCSSSRNTLAGGGALVAAGNSVASPDFWVNVFGGGGGATAFCGAYSGTVAVGPSGSGLIQIEW